MISQKEQVQVYESKVKLEIEIVPVYFENEEEQVEPEGELEQFNSEEEQTTNDQWESVPQKIAAYEAKIIQINNA